MPEASTHRIDSKSLTAFILVILLGGSNSVAIRFSNLELAPFWGAFLRLMPAALIYWAILFGRKMSMPTFKDSAVIAINGFVSTGVGFALLYWGLHCWAGHCRHFNGTLIYFDIGSFASA